MKNKELISWWEIKKYGKQEDIFEDFLVTHFESFTEKEMKGKYQKN